MLQPSAVIPRFNPCFTTLILCLLLLSQHASPASALPPAAICGGGWVHVRTVEELFEALENQSVSKIYIEEGVYEVTSEIKIERNLWIAGAGAGRTILNLYKTMKIGPGDGETARISNLTIDFLGESGVAAQVFRKVKRGEAVIGSVILDGVAISADVGVDIGVQVGPHIRINQIAILNSAVFVNEAGIQVGPYVSEASVDIGLVKIEGSLIHALGENSAGIKIGPQNIISHVEITGNVISAGAGGVGVDIGPNTQMMGVASQFDVVSIVGNIISGPRKAISIRNVEVKDALNIYLNIFFGDGEAADIEIKRSIIGSVALWSPMEYRYFYRGRYHVSRLGNHYVDWTQPDEREGGGGEGADGIVDEPRNVAGYFDEYPVADPIILLMALGRAKPPEEDGGAGGGGAEGGGGGANAAIVMGGSALAYRQGQAALISLILMLSCAYYAFRRIGREANRPLTYLEF